MGHMLIPVINGALVTLIIRCSMRVLVNVFIMNTQTGTSYGQKKLNRIKSDQYIDLNCDCCTGQVRLYYISLKCPGTSRFSLVFHSPCSTALA